MSETNNIRLRKPHENEIYGPMDMDELKHLANTAYVSPEDEISFDSGDWMPAPLCEELEMVWTIQSADGTSYGPTTVGTVKEFLIAGEVSENDRLVHGKTGEEHSIQEVLGEEGMKEAETEIIEARTPQTDEGLTESMEIAKDLRIRNLETEMEILKKDSDDLKQKYLQACEELAKLSKA